VSAYLKKLNAPLYAVLDSARSRMVLALLKDAPNRHESLYDGYEAQRLLEVAPYLVQLDTDSNLFAALCDQHCGEGLGVFLTSNAPFDSLRAHLARLVKMKTEDDAEVYLRFYDPRVLPTFASSLSPREASLFFGPVDTYLAEQEGAALLSFQLSRDGVSTQRTDLSSQR
jgi:hypothetical protein